MHIDTGTVKLIQNSLRQASIIWHVRKEVMLEAKTRVHIGKYKNGKDKYKVKYICNHCKKPWNEEQVEVDHIIEVAHNIAPPSKMTKAELLLWISQLFCDKSNLQVLCIGCHQTKTNNFTRGKKLADKFKSKKVSLI